MMQSIRIFIGIGAVVALSACASAKLETRPGNPQMVAQPDKVSALLADAADRAADALQTLAAVEQTRTPLVTPPSVPNAPPELRRAITLRWVGPVEPIARTLSEHASYAFETFGKVPPTPMVVDIDAENQPVVDVLRNLGLQMGARADLKVNGAARVVELHYAPVTAGNKAVNE